MFALAMPHTSHDSALNLRLAELLCTKLCHDITGPIGAINNGAELLAEDPENMADATGLIASSAKEAVARIRYFRLCFGATRAGGQVSLSDIQTMIRDFFESTRCKLAWQLHAAMHRQGALAPAEARLLAMMALTAEEAMIRGGSLTIESEDGPEGVRYQLRAEGQRIQFDAEHMAQLTNSAAESQATAHNIHVTWLRIVAGELGMSLQCSLSPEGTSMILTARRTGSNG